MVSAGAVVDWSDIAKAYGRRTLFSGLSGALGPGNTLVVTGANGSGKSTFLKVVAGLLSPDQGKMRRPPANLIGYCAPSLELYGDLTGSENLHFFCKVAGVDLCRSSDLLLTVGLAKAQGKLYSSYSSGMKQRLKLAFALIGSPDLLILDEPATALDSDGVQIVDDIVSRHRAAGGATLIASNDRAEAARWADARLEIGSQAW